MTLLALVDGGAKATRGRDDGMDRKDDGTRVCERRPNESSIRTR
jgi:hypothetical protein